MEDNEENEAGIRGNKVRSLSQVIQFASEQYFDYLCIFYKRRRL